MKKCDMHTAESVSASGDASKNPIIFIKPSELPLACPRPNAPLWSLHPRVFLPIQEEGGKITCPYCSTIYQVQ
jgi:uncharacterized Zn-finger protein